MNLVADPDKIKHFHWMAQIDDRHVALFHKDGTVELHPVDGDPIVMQPPPEFAAQVEGLDTLGALAFQFKILAEYVGGLRSAIVELMDVLPDSDHLPDGRGHDPWMHCWDELDDPGQQEVKAARRHANEAIR